MLSFEEIAHVYKWCGEVVPSVTQILCEYLNLHRLHVYVHTRSGNTINAQIFEDAQDFGTAIHKAAAYILSGQGVQWNHLDPSLVPPLREIERWMDDYDVRPHFIEQPMFSEKHRVAGTPDIIGELRGFKNLCLIDIKTGLKNGMVGPQLAGYELIFREQEKYRKPIIRHELILPRNGDAYKFKVVEGINDGAYFLSKLFQYNFQGGL